MSTLNTQADNSSPDDPMSDLIDMGDMGGMKDDGKDDGNMDNGNPDRPSDDTQLIDRPPANFMPNKKPDFPGVPFLDHDSHDHDHHNHEQIFDHPPHGDHYDSGPFSPYDDSLKHLHGFDAFPGNYTNLF